jgi:23S rRNA (pseudouridine1915-N3)-methyltransferase
MKILFRLGWVKPGPVQPRHFKSKAQHELFGDYLKRISHYCRTEVSGIDLKDPEPIRGKVWFCHREAKGPSLSSEGLAGKMGSLMNQGIGEWHIVIGAADGFTEETIARWRPSYLWSFGPLTFTHEMASVVAGEQVYRAWTLLKNQPYHAGH